MSKTSLLAIVSLALSMLAMGVAAQTLPSTAVNDSVELEPIVVTASH